MAPKRRKRKPVRFRKLSFKMTEGQKAALDRFCRINNTTPVRFIKALVNHHVARYRPENLPPSYVTENQLQLFDEDMH